MKGFKVSTKIRKAIERCNQYGLEDYRFGLQLTNESAIIARTHNICRFDIENQIMQGVVASRLNENREILAFI